MPYIPLRSRLTGELRARALKIVRCGVALMGRIGVVRTARRTIDVGRWSGMVCWVGKSVADSGVKEFAVRLSSCQPSGVTVRVTLRCQVTRRKLRFASNL